MEHPSPESPPARVGSGIVLGVDAVAVVVEALVHGDGPGVLLLGSVDRVVRESFHRVLDAFVAQGIPSPRGKPTVNFAPAGVPKTGTGFDLPLALALAGAGGLVDAELLAGTAAYGELGLDGLVCATPGIVPVALAARERGWDRILASPRDAARAALIPGVEAVPVHSLAEALAVVRGLVAPRPACAEPLDAPPAAVVADLADIRGHETAKRALCAAACGRHNVLLVGPPGSGKSALATRFRGLLPPLRDDEQLDVLRISSAHGDSHAPLQHWTELRPFRAPHHSSSAASLLGGGSWPRPGEVTLAHHGVLFLDELPEFRREALEGLRQPLEERHITIGRAQRTVTLPADFVLLAAMNPCPCGYLGDSHNACRCAPRERAAYRTRISGPLLDRFDLVVRVPTLDAEVYESEPDPAWGTAQLRATVLAAAARQSHRDPNGRLDGESLDAVVPLDGATREALARIAKLQRLSGRGRTRIRRLARTLADLAGRESVEATDLFEAAQLRALPQASGRR